MRVVQLSGMLCGEKMKEKKTLRTNSFSLMDKIRAGIAPVLVM